MYCYHLLYSSKALKWLAHWKHYKHNALLVGFYKSKTDRSPVKIITGRGGKLVFIEYTLYLLPGEIIEHKTAKYIDTYVLYVLQS